MMNQKIASILVVVLAFLLYANTLQNDYVLDDHELILKNKQVQQGLSGIGAIFSSKLRDGSTAAKNELYRPLTKLVYALEWDLAPNNPFVAHLFNVLLYSLLAFLIFKLALVLFKNKVLPSFFATLFFVFHPIHSEVVANIKSVDEILALLLFVSALLYLNRYLLENKNQFLYAAAGFYLLSLFAKESAVAFVVLIPVFMYFSTKKQMADVLKTSVYFVVPLLFFLLLRNRIMGDYDHSKMIGKIDNFLIAAHSSSEKLGSSLNMLGAYIKLLFVPYPLVSDYSFHHFPYVGFKNLTVLFTFAFMVYLIVFAFKKYKEKNLLSFFIIWFIVSMLITSNIFYLIGTNFGERLLFAPSLAFCFALSYFLFVYVPAKSKKYYVTISNLRTKKLDQGIAILILVSYGIICFGRNAEWKSNYSLAKADVAKNSNSARLHVFYAAELRNEIVANKNSEAIQKTNLPLIRKNLQEAVIIYPEYGTAHLAFAEYYMHRDSSRSALTQLNQALYTLPRSPRVLSAMGNCYINLQKYDSALLYLKTGLRFTPNHPDLIAKYGATLMHLNKPDSAIYLLKQADAISPDNSWNLEQLAKAYVMKKDSAKARYYEKRAKEMK